MKRVCSIKINNPAVYSRCIERQLDILGYNVSDAYLSDFSFCPWLLAYYDNGPKVCNCNDGMYRNMRQSDEFEVEEHGTVKAFIDAASVVKLPNYALF